MRSIIPALYSLCARRLDSTGYADIPYIPEMSWTDHFGVSDGEICGLPVKRWTVVRLTRKQNRRSPTKGQFLQMQHAGFRVQREIALRMAHHRTRSS